MGVSYISKTILQLLYLIKSNCFILMYNTMICDLGKLSIHKLDLICLVFPDHIEIASAKKTPYTMSTGSNEVPVSVVDIDVPVTAIDDVLGDYEHDIGENEAKSVTGTESAGSKGRVQAEFCAFDDFVDI